MRELLTAAEIAALLHNGHCSAGGMDIDPLPVAHIFIPGTEAGWLITEMDPDDEDRLFALCDLGMGFVELGSVRMSEIAGLKDSLGLTPMRNDAFVPVAPLSAYAEASRRAQTLVTDPDKVRAPRARAPGS